MPPEQSETRLASGRAAYERRAWREAYEGLSACDEAARLDAEDLVMRVVDGRVLEHWGLADQASVLLQIGAMRPPA